MAYVLAILASLLVALTVTPALSLMLLTGATERSDEAPAGRAVLKHVYDALLPPLVARPWTWRRRDRGHVSRRRGWAVLRLGEEFLPNFQETDFLMHWVEKPGTSLDAMRRDDGPGQHASCATIPGRPQLRLAHRPRRSRR